MINQLFNYNNEVIVFDNSVIMIKNDFIENNRDNRFTNNIADRFDQLLGVCFGSSWLKCPYNDCESYSMILIDKFSVDRFDGDGQTIAINLISMLNNNPNSIKSMITAVQGANGSVELFDACTDVSERGKGYLKELVKTAFQMASNYVWVGIKIVDNPYREKLVKLYISIGFSHPVLTNTTYDKSFEFPFYNISLTWYKNKGARIFDRYEGESLATYKELSYQSAIALMRNYEMCSFTLIIDNTTLRYLWDNFIPDQEGVLGRGLEYGGNLMLNKDNLLSLDVDSIHKGEFESVAFDLGSFNFHTHHAQCYKKHKCILGWPSSFDFSISLLNSESNILSMVVAIEGYYTYQVTKQLKDYFQSLNKRQRAIIYQGFVEFLGTYYEKVGEGNLNQLFKNPNDPNEFLGYINNASFVEFFQFTGQRVMEPSDNADWIVAIRDDEDFPFPYTDWNDNQQNRWFQDVDDFFLYVVNFAPKDYVYSTSQNLDITISNILNDRCLVTNIKGKTPEEIRDEITRMEIE